MMIALDETPGEGGENPEEALEEGVQDPKTVTGLEAGQGEDECSTPGEDEAAAGEDALDDTELYDVEEEETAGSVS
jgi:hypothetical protein